MMEKYRGEDFSWNKLISSLPKPHLLQTWEWDTMYHLLNRLADQTGDNHTFRIN